MPKSLTRERLPSRKEKAVRFVRDVLHDPERAGEIEEESLEDYAERGENPNSESMWKEGGWVYTDRHPGSKWKSRLNIE